jgi:hypothetical protein
MAKTPPRITPTLAWMINTRLLVHCDECHREAYCEISALNPARPPVCQFSPLDEQADAICGGFLRVLGRA